MADVQQALALLEDHQSTNRECVEEIEAALGLVIHEYTLVDAEEALSLVRYMLPGWWWTTGLCALTGHASIGPDAGAPNAAELQPLLDSDIFANGFDADLAPGDGMHRVCRALIHCLVQAVAAKRKFEAPTL